MPGLVGTLRGGRARRRISRTIAIGVVALAAALLPVTCMCDLAHAAGPSKAAARGCHQAPAQTPGAPAHDRGCSHCHATIGAPASTRPVSTAGSDWSSLMVVTPARHAVPAGAVRDVGQRADAPPPRTLLHRTCVLLT